MSHILLELKNIKKHYHINKNTVKEALKGITLSLFEGEVFGLLGVNGAGKTTLSSIIATLHPATSGDILYNEQSIYRDIPGYRRMIGFCPQRPNLINDLTVEENLILAGLYYGGNKKAVYARAQEIIARYDLMDYRHQKPEVLSGGYRQRVLIARSIMHKPQLLILDEPTVGLDPHVRHQLWEEIRLLRQENITVILTTHYLDEAEILADRICILDQGAIRIIGTPSELMTTYEKSCLEDVFLQLMHEEKS